MPIGELRVNQAAAGCRFFPETGHSLCGAFLPHWDRNGDLARFGLPITETAVDAVFAYDGEQISGGLTPPPGHYEPFAGLMCRVGRSASLCNERSATDDASRCFETKRRRNDASER